MEMPSNESTSMGNEEVASPILDALVATREQALDFKPNVEALSSSGSTGSTTRGITPTMEFYYGDNGYPLPADYYDDNYQPFSELQQGPWGEES